MLVWRENSHTSRPTNRNVAPVMTKVYRRKDQLLDMREITVISERN